jgi:hypothetical protein
MPRAIAEVPVGTESATASGRTPAVHHPEAPSAVQSLNPNRKALQAQSSKSSCEVTSLRPSAVRAWAPRAGASPAIRLPQRWPLRARGGRFCPAPRPRDRPRGGYGDAVISAPHLPTHPSFPTPPYSHVVQGKATGRRVRRTEAYSRRARFVGWPSFRQSFSSLPGSSPRRCPRPPAMSSSTDGHSAESLKGRCVPVWPGLHRASCHCSPEKMHAGVLNHAISGEAARPSP